MWPCFLDNISGVSPSWFVMAVSVPWLIKQFIAGMCPDAAQCAGVFPKSERIIIGVFYRTILIVTKNGTSEILSSRGGGGVGFQRMLRTVKRLQKLNLKLSFKTQFFHHNVDVNHNEVV